MEEVRDVEVFEQEPETVDQNGGVPVMSLSALANRSKSSALAAVQTMVDILETVRKAAIKMTVPSDWLLYRDHESGRETAYLQDCGCQRVRDIFGICIYPTNDPELITGDNPDDFAYSITGGGVSKLTTQTIEGVEGLKTSAEIKTNPAFSRLTGAALKVQVRKHARANLDGTITRKLTGLSNLPAEKLREAGINLDRCIKARGYSKTEKQAVQAATGESCPECGSDLRIVPAGVSKSGKAYDAFYACKNRDCKFTAKIQPEQPREREPGEDD